MNKKLLTLSICSLLLVGCGDEAPKSEVSLKTPEDAAAVRDVLSTTISNSVNGLIDGGGISGSFELEAPSGIDSVTSNSKQSLSFDFEAGWSSLKNTKAKDIDAYFTISDFDSNTTLSLVDDSTGSTSTVPLVFDDLKLSAYLDNTNVYVDGSNSVVEEVIRKVIETELKNEGTEPTEEDISSVYDLFVPLFAGETRKFYIPEIFDSEETISSEGLSSEDINNGLFSDSEMFTELSDIGFVKVFNNKKANDLVLTLNPQIVSSLSGLEVSELEEEGLKALDATITLSAKNDFFTKFDFDIEATISMEGVEAEFDLDFSINFDYDANVKLPSDLNSYTLSPMFEE